MVGHGHSSPSASRGYNSEAYLSEVTLACSDFSADRKLSYHPRMRRSSTDTNLAIVKQDRPMTRRGTHHIRLARLRSQQDVVAIMEPCVVEADQLPSLVEGADEEDGLTGDVPQGRRLSVISAPIRSLLGYSPLPGDDPGSDAEVLQQESFAGHVSLVKQDLEHCTSSLRKVLLKVLQSIAFQCITVSCIVLNAVIIGFETDMPELSCWSSIELAFLILFTVEVAMRVFVHGLRRFFCGEGCLWFGGHAAAEGSDNLQRLRGAGRGIPDLVWNIFDFTIVSAGCMNLLFATAFSGLGKTTGGSATLLRTVRLLRLLRILRVVRVVRFLKQLYLLAYGFMEGAMAVFWVAVLAASVMYVCSIVLVRSYHSKDPDSPGYEFFETHFYSIPGAMFTLFEIMASPTLTNYREVLSHSPLLAAFIVVFVIFGSFGMNGLLTGVISESIMDKNQVRLELMQKEQESKRRLLDGCCEDLFKELVDDPEGLASMSYDTFMDNIEDIAAVVSAAGATVAADDLEDMFVAMDFADRGCLDKAEFIRGIVHLCQDVRPISVMEIYSQVLRTQLKVDQQSSHLERLAAAMHEVMYDYRRQHGQGTPLEAAHFSPVQEEASGSTVPLTYSDDWSCLEEGPAAAASEPSGSPQHMVAAIKPAGSGSDPIGNPEHARDAGEPASSPELAQAASKLAGAGSGHSGSPLHTGSPRHAAAAAAARPASAEPAAGSREGASELAALGSLQRRLAAAARSGEGQAAGELADLGRQLARLVQDNAELIGECLSAQSMPVQVSLEGSVRHGSPN